MAWCVLLVGVLASTGGAMWWQASKTDDVRASFDRSVDLVAAAVNTELARYVGVLSTTRAGLDAEGGLTAPSFARYVDGLDLSREYPSADGLALISAGPRPTATVAAPTNRWVSQGFSFPARSPVRNALERSRGSGRAILSERFTPSFADEGLPAANKHDGFVAVLPRDAGGWVAIHFRGDGFLDGVLGRTGFAARLELFDGPDPAKAKRLAGTATQTPVATGSDALTTITPIDVYGRAWTLRAEALPAFGELTRDHSAWIVLLAGLAVTGMLFAILRVLIGQKARVDEQVEVTTADLRSSEDRFRSLAASSPIGIFSADAAGAIEWVNDELMELTGLDAAASRGIGWRRLVHREDAGRLESEMAAVRERGALSLQLRLHRADGVERWVHLRVAPVEGSADLQGSLVGNLEDITERRTFEVELEHNALHDLLTGLPNRALFADRVATALARGTRTEDQVAVLFVDLDRFKVVNDSLGHSAGDALLVTTAERLSAAVRPQDTVARFGGDEFTVLCDGLTEGEGAVGVAERILEAMAAPVHVGGAELHATASIGIAYGSGPDTTPEALVRDADAAMYRAKRRGKSRVEIFDDALRADATAHLDVENGLRRALEREELHVLYQPKVELATGRIHGAEALVRWERPGIGLVSPAEFIPIAEETGMIVEIGAWVLRTACAQAVEWTKRWPTAPLVAVNLSARQLGDPKLVPMVVDVLATTRLAPRQLCLEITESTLMDDADGCVEALRRLRSLGVRLAIDDFGTGYSSLSYLQRFPVTELKVDRSFVSPLHAGGEEQIAIVEAIVGLAHALRLTVVAEGVETGEQASIVTELGCALGQGFLWSRPVDAAAVEALACAGGFTAGSAGRRQLEVESSPRSPMPMLRT